MSRPRHRRARPRRRNFWRAWRETPLASALAALALGILLTVIVWAGRVGITGGVSPGLAPTDAALGFAGGFLSWLGQLTGLHRHGIAFLPTAPEADLDDPRQFPPQPWLTWLTHLALVLYVAGLPALGTALSIRVHLPHPWRALALLGLAGSLTALGLLALWRPNQLNRWLYRYERIFWLLPLPAMGNPTLGAYSGLTARRFDQVWLLQLIVTLGLAVLAHWLLATGLLSVWSHRPRRMTAQQPAPETGSFRPVGRDPEP
ncbi:hypothetical protein [Thermomicrobium roseum]|uniref:Uncharacterized protein n=1 Tax=Thermomicrobium roseum (strain ATCC 27502 / DSM 5159 / P-2) TaxID=309801 RepID=B9L3W0_THERP|nr:hypothetical protein [Thermomicrobium roseum]ACM07093.1 hypothetical protein trd_A0474 [Thermomicrobium roseum DSM 5159]